VLVNGGNVLFCIALEIDMKTDDISIKASDAILSNRHSASSCPPCSEYTDQAPKRDCRFSPTAFVEVL